MRVLGTREKSNCCFRLGRDEELKRPSLLSRFLPLLPHQAMSTTMRRTDAASQATLQPLDNAEQGEIGLADLVTNQPS